MHSRPNEKNFSEQLETFLKLMDFTRYNVYRFHSDEEFKKHVKEACGLIESLNDEKILLDKKSGAQCAALSRQLGIYFAYCAGDHKLAAKYFVNHRTIHDTASKLHANKEAAIAQLGSLEAYTRNEVEIVDSWTHVLYGQCIDGLHHVKLMDYLEEHLKEYERLEKSAEHQTQLQEIQLGKALILNCLALKYNERSIKPRENKTELNNKAIRYLSEAIMLQQKRAEADPLISIDSAQSYYLLAVVCRNHFDFENASKQITLAEVILKNLKNITHYTFPIEYNVRQLHADILRAEKKFAECVTLMGEIIEMQTVDSAEESNTNIVRSQQILKFVWDEHIEPVPNYNWDDIQISNKHIENIKLIQPAIIAFNKIKHLLPSDLRIKLGQKTFALGTHLNHFANKPVMALECFLTAIETTRDLFQVYWIKLEVAFSHQQIVCNLKNPQHKPAAEDAQSILQNLTVCEGLLEECEKCICSFSKADKIRHHVEITKLLTYLLYLRSLLEYARTKLVDPRECQTRYAMAIDYIQKSIACGLETENNLIVYIKCYYARLLSKINNPSFDPIAHFRELETFFARSDQKNNPAAIDLFVFYGSYLYTCHKKKSNIELLKSSLEKYEIAYNRLSVLESGTTSAYSKNISEQIEYLKRKLNSPTLTGRRNSLFSAGAASNDAKVEATTPTRLSPTLSGRE